ncbi:hypothetical protein M9H77_12717 [Catharanthus roseus]|uniref:Uncharacterized protein n=1 Tax=Catharanthus roseus TaxID=4058 RepID=A0ACC0BIE1_CATRO|nr:hypothetical protein M9H77_12717 [Catharanthus roseus]
MVATMVINKGIKLLTKSSGKCPASRTNLLSSKSVVPKLEASIYKSWSKKENRPKVAFKDHCIPKVEEKGRLITNPTMRFKCNVVGHIAINCPIERTLVFNEDFNGWIETNDDDFQEGIVDKDERTRVIGSRKRKGAFTHKRETKANNENVDNGMVAYMENALKIKFECFEDQEQVSKLLIILAVDKDY